MKNLLTIWLLLSMTHGIHADRESSEAAFTTFKRLQGTWSITSEGKPIATKMVYEVGSKGSIVTEQFGKELSVFYRDGSGLVMIHFCNAGNQPRLRLKENGEPGVLEFEMFEITNLKSAETAHVERMIYRLIDDGKMELEIVWRTGSKQETERCRLIRG